MPDPASPGDQASTSWLALRARAIPAMRGIPGAMALHEFGATSAGRVDAWSDIDLQLVVASLGNAVSERGGALREIGPVWLEWTIVDSPTSWAATILFEGLSPLHHLDFGMVEVGAGDKNPFLDGVIIHWQQAGERSPGQSSPDWYTPEMGSTEHLVLGELLGLVRYAKARHRGHSLMCWKFFSALANRVLEAEYLRRVDPARGFRKPLTSHEQARLREAMPVGEMNALAAMLFCDDAQAMDNAIVALGRRLVDESAISSDLFHTRCGRLLEWLAQELGVDPGA